jgi:hypothetical protein
MHSYNAKKNEINEVVIGVLTIQYLVLSEVDDGTLAKYILNSIDV